MARAGFSSQLGNHHAMVSAWVDVAPSRTAAPNINCRFMFSSVRYSLKASIFFDTLRQTIDRESFRIIESGDRFGVLCRGGKRLHSKGYISSHSSSQSTNDDIR